MDRFNTIFSKVFTSSKKATLYCQTLARLCGFSVRIRTSKTTTIYMVCSREGLPEANRDGSKRRSRNSERCNCDWRIVLFRRDRDNWEFRAGKSAEHNHPIYSSEDLLEAEEKTEPNQVSEPVSTCHSNSNSSCGSHSPGPSSPLPSLRSLELPAPGSRVLPSNSSLSCTGDSSTLNSGNSESISSGSSHSTQPTLDDFPPLTRALPKIMKVEHIPFAPSRSNISFLLN